MNARAERHPEVRVTVAVGAALLVQSALALVWAGAAAERLSQIEERQAAAEEASERLARLEEQMHAARASLLRIEAKLDRKEERT